jgi:Domain of unknown function (DUF1841)
MTSYDPEVTPDANEWLAASEEVRIQLAQDFHVRAKIKVPGLKSHAAIHAIVENQIALNHPPNIRAMERLQSGGISRHDAIHALGSVIAEMFFQLNTNSEEIDEGELQARVDAAIEKLTAQNLSVQF